MMEVVEVEVRRSLGLSSMHRWPGLLEMARRVLGSASCFYVYMLCIGFPFLSTFQSLLNSVPVPCRSLPASATRAKPSGDISLSAACAF